MALSMARKRYKKLKSLVYLLDNGKCHICSKKVTFAKAVLDHVIPVATSGNGGGLSSDAYWNLRLAHKSCNTIRGSAKTPGQLRLHIAPEGFEKKEKAVA